jgi:hypothetical protein
LGSRSLNRIVRATLVAILVGALASLGAVAPALGATRVPKVVFIVGPVGSLTAGYRTQADAAARVAAAAGAEVVKVYSPNATWPAVEAATEGASIVVYLGHGNGWPSRYRDSLYPPTQNGFGLNPVAGVDDSAHQYFGEASIRHLHLAANAVVLLHHLCYASGNTEPGLPEGTQAQAIQRVDNYAAGFLQAGARAVVAEGHLGPTYYVKALLTTDRTIEQIWQRSPTARSNELAVLSTRSPGYTERLDPDTTSGGYFRSLVSQGLDASALRASAVGTPGLVTSTTPAQPSLANLGLRFGTPSLRTMPIADATTRLTLSMSKAAAAKVPKGAQVGVRWDPILLDPVIAVPEPAPTASPAASAPPAVASPEPSGVPVVASPEPSTSPAASTLPSPSPAVVPDQGGDAPDVALVAPEQLGSVVTLARVIRTSSGLALDVRYPAAPGLYRLVPTLHTASGVAYDAATQALLTPVIVRVGGPYSVAYGAPAAVTVESGLPSSIAVRVVNAGTETWDVASSMPPSRPDELLVWLRTSRAPARLVGTWVSADGLPVPQPAIVALDPESVGPGGSTVVSLDLVAPATPGQYLLMLDVVSPTMGPLSAYGSAPGLVRVTVWPSATPPAPSSIPPSPAPAGPGL